MESSKDMSLMSCIGKGFATSVIGGACLLAVLAVPPVASRLVRLKLPNSWSFYGPIMFAKPFSAGVVALTPFVAWGYYTQEKEEVATERYK